MACQDNIKQAGSFGQAKGKLETVHRKHTN